MNVSRILFAVRWPRTSWAIGLVLPLVVLTAPAARAAPKVEWVPGSQNQARAFEVTTSRVHLVDSFELRGGFDTRAEAEAEVKRLLAIDASSKAVRPGIASGWDFAVIRVTERRAAMKGQTDLNLAIAAINRLYVWVKRIRDRELRYFASGSRLSTPDTRAEANRAITYFNQELRLVRKRFGEAFEDRTGRMMVELPLIGEPGKQPPERKPEPGPEFFAMQQGGFTPSEQWYTVGAQEMIVQFFMQPYVISDSFEVLGDTGGGSGIALIKQFEGVNGLPVLTAYPDPKTKKEPYTIGWGSTRKRDGSPFRLGEKITHKEADDLLLYDIERRFLPGLKTSIPFWDELSESQRGALLSFAYNLGSNFYGHPKFQTISRVLREKRWDDVPAALELYRNPGTKVEKGLHRRRLAEGSLWRTPLRHFVRRDQISTTTPNADVPLRQQQVVRDTFTKPAGVTRIVVRVTPNPASNSTKWWYLARTDGKNFWEK